jgi:hypothetical protein
VPGCRGFSVRDSAGAADQCEFAATLDQRGAEQGRAGEERGKLGWADGAGVPAGGDCEIETDGGIAAPDPSAGAKERPAGHDRVADDGVRILCGVAEGAAGLIRIEEVWMAVAPLDMRAGTDTALARVIHVFGYARAHHAYLFANKRANRMKVLVHDGFGMWLCARRLHKGGFVWGQSHLGTTLTLTVEQLDALVLGLPWHQIADLRTIRVI